jgi:hypothetical protein
VSSSEIHSPKTKEGEKTMSKSVPLVACLVCLAVLIGLGGISTRAGTLSPVLAKPFLSTTNLAVSCPTVAYSLAAAMGSPTMKLTQGDSDEDAAEEKADHEKEDHDVDSDDHPPVPEPSTLMSFGVALLIGGGVFFLGRLRKERK